MIFLVILSVSIAFISLFWMGWIDLKLWILPNELVALFALSAIPFHFATDWMGGTWLFMLIGAIIGGGSLLLIRAAANKFYGMETLGLGDVKLMSAAGLWLGPQGVLLGLSIGALCGVLHAFIIAFFHRKSLKRLMLPAGPGFIAGIILIGVWLYKDIYL
jgi:leader peptidase (prepilin peptidase)/N-methyltransferase